MSQTIIVKSCFAAAIVAMILLAGWYPFNRKKKLALSHDHHDFPIGETLATGVFLGAALMHMLPESVHLFHSLSLSYPFAFLIAGLTFLFFLWFEHLGTELYEGAHSQRTFALLAWIMLSLHSFMTGAALGIAESPSIMFMLFFAIMAHKWAESFAIAVQLTKSTLKRKSAIFLFLLFSLMTPLGMLIGWYGGQQTTTHALSDAILMSASSGTFLYLGTLHGLERCVLVQRCCNLKDFSYVILGFLLMSTVAIYS